LGEGKKVEIQGEHIRVERGRIDGRNSSEAESMNQEGARDVWETEERLNLRDRRRVIHQKV